MIIDGHAHACGVYVNATSITKYLNEHHIDKLVLCGGESKSRRNYRYPMLGNVIKSESLPYVWNRLIGILIRRKRLNSTIEQQNEAVYRIARRMNGRVIQAYWVDPMQEDCMKKLEEAYEKYQFKMIKLHQCWTEFDLLSRQSRAVFRFAKLHGLPVFIHLSDAMQARKLAKVADQFPELPIIVAHLIGFSAITGHTESEEVYFDLSAPQLYSKETLKEAIGLVGAERLILGSDHPYGCNNIERVLERLRKMNISDRDMDLICGGNLEQLLHL